MTMHVSSISMISGSHAAHISLQAAYGATVDLTVYDDDTESTITLDIETVEDLIAELKDVLHKMKGYEAAQDKDAWIEADLG